MDGTKFYRGQRVRINERAVDHVPEYVGMLGRIGIGGIHAPYYYAGEYYVSVRRENGARIIVQLPEECIDEAPSEFRL